MAAQKDYIHALKAFSKEVDAPKILVCDSQFTQVKKEVQD